MIRDIIKRNIIKRNILKGDKIHKGYGPSIKLQLIIGFILPILFLIFIGMFSYIKAKESLISNYEKAALSSISMGSRYLDFGFKMAVSDNLQLTLDSSLADYAYGRYEKDPAQANIIYNKLISSIMVKQTSNSFVEAVRIIPKSLGKVMSSGSGNGGKGFFEEWTESEEGKIAMSGNSNFSWMGKHPFIDEKTQSKEDDYAISYIGVLTNKAACVVIDISKDSVLESLKGLNLGEGSLAAFITKDQREITYYYDGEKEKKNNGPEDIVFSDKDFFISTMDKQENAGYKYITYEGVEYLFMYSRSDINGSSLCALVPYSLVIKGAFDIRNMTNGLVVVACVAVGIIALLISLNISFSMREIIKKLKKVAGGDLTVELNVQGKSEFSLLSQNIMAVVANTRALIQKVQDTLGTVQESTSKVASVSDKIWSTSENISSAVKNIDGGISDQSASVQSCAAMMGQLSDRISTINRNTSEVESYTNSTQEMIVTGIRTVEELSGQSHSTTEITEKVEENVDLLVKETSKIHDFIRIINEISEQTNLLALNASIEAARAGQAGKGFAVVAEEVRKLADRSMKASSEVEDVVKLIQKRMVETAKVAGRAGDVVDLQTAKVMQTKEVFNNISDYMKQLLDKLADVCESVKSADEERGVALEAIENISVAALQTAEASSVVNKTVDGQLDIADILKEAAEELSHNMKELTESLSVFDI